MEPFLAIGNLLKEKGDQVICAFPEQYRSLAEDSNMEFVSLGTKFIELLESDDGKAIYPIIWGLNNRGKTILVSPVPYVHYVRNHTHVAFNSNYGPFLNKLTYSLANFGLIHFVNQIPYDWILPKVYGIIHHGGSGTTHLGLTHGCATMIIPHIIDQFVWNKMIYTMEAGPKGMNIHKITTKNLEPKILELVNNASFKKQAEKVAHQMKKEDFTEELYTSIVE